MERENQNKNTGPIKLTIVCSYFYPKIGGLETIAYTTGKMLHQSGKYSISIITSNYDGAGYKKEIIDGMTVHRLPIWFKFSNSPINPMWYFMIKKIYREENTQIVHGHLPVPFMVDLAIRVAKSMNIPRVVTYHSGSMKKGSKILDPILGLYEHVFLRKLFKISNRVVTVHQEFMRKNYPEVANKTSFIPTGVDLTRFEKTTAPEGAKATFIGRIEHSSSWKGIGELLKAMSIVLRKKPEARVELVGGGDALEFYKEMGKTLGLGKSLEVVGPKYGNDLVQVYKNTNVIVLPSTSDSEAFSVTLVEAMASGRPIIGTRAGGTPQVIEDGKNGLLVSPKDPEALAVAILRVLDDRALAQGMGEDGAGRSFNFSWNIQTKKYEDLFDSVLKQIL